MLSLSRLPTVAALCGAALFGWSLGGVATVDRDLQAVVPQRQERHGHLVLDRDSGRHGHSGDGEL
jgi:hypothetical protein